MKQDGTGQSVLGCKLNVDTEDVEPNRPLTDKMALTASCLICCFCLLGMMIRCVGHRHTYGKSR